MLLKSAISLFILSRQSKSLSPETIRWYGSTFKLYGEKFTKVPLKPEYIELFLSGLRAKDERLHGHYRVLRCFYNFLAKRRLIKNNPIELIDPPIIKKKQPTYVLFDDLYKLLSYPHRKDVKAALLFLIDTGCRISELATLTIDMLNETPWGFTATVSGKTGERIVPISYDSYHAMMITLPFKYKPHRLSRLVSLAFQEAGVKGTAHALRHTFATLWDGDELALQKIMGHAHLSTTQGYRHLRAEYLLRQHQQYSPLKMLLSTSKSML